MRYQLINQNHNNLKIEDILINRGIPENKIQHYLNLTEESINDYSYFNLNVLKGAANCLLQTISKNNSATIVVDCDADGFCSAAIFANYIYNYFPNWTDNHLHFQFHEGKEHGLKDCVEELLLSEDTLIICPDSASNDYEEHQKLTEQGKSIIILDHHEAERISDYQNVYVINNQLCDYPNKALCGGGVVWQFCRYLNDKLFQDNYHNHFLDLVSLSLISDMMDMRNFETAYLIREGLKEENIVNPFVSSMNERNAFSIGPEPTPIAWAFYITPFLNSAMRSGTIEEKKLIFDAMLEYKAYQRIPSTKRGCKGQEESLLEQAIRTAVNVKSRQTKAQDIGMALLEKKIEENDMLSDKVLVFLLEAGEIAGGLAGLAGNKIMAKYQKPCCVLTRHVEADENTPPWEDPIETKVTYQGSARGCEIVGVNTFKDVCEGFPETIYAQGHQGAFGLSLPEKAVPAFIDYMNDYYKSLPDEPIYYVDVISNEKLKGEDILSIAEMNYLWGQNVKEPLVILEKINVTANMISIYEKRDFTLKIQLPNFSLMKFKLSKEEVDFFRSISSTGSATITFVGVCMKNNYNGVNYPQLKIIDYEVLTQKLFDF